jgi:hypothetical protein
MENQNEQIGLFLRILIGAVKGRSPPDAAERAVVIVAPGGADPD